MSQQVTDEIKIYSTSAVKKALDETFDGRYKMFGGIISDSAVVALSIDGLASFLQTNSADRDMYVLDKGNRNYDCENFAEKLRCDLQNKHGINGVGIIWGDGHAWNFFVINGGEEPKIVMIEPQDDSIVSNTFDGQYSIERRCEILL